MARKEIGSIFDRNNRNNMNDNFKELYEGRQKIDELSIRADTVLNEAKKTTDMNKDVQNQIDNLILSDGQSDAEVIQARGGLPLLKDRLDNQDKVIEDNKILSFPHGNLVDKVKTLINVRGMYASVRNNHLHIGIGMGNEKALVEYRFTYNSDSILLLRGVRSGVEDEGHGFINPVFEGTFTFSAEPSVFTSTVGDYFDFEFEGKSLEFQSVKDNRGGVWEFILDTGERAFVSCYADTAEYYPITKVFKDLEHKKRKGRAIFRGADPINPPNGGSARGWVYYRTDGSSSPLRVGDIHLIKESSAKWIVSPDSIPDFAMYGKPENASYSGEWVPAHGSVRGVSSNNTIKILIDEILSVDDGAPNKALPLFIFKEIDSIKISQMFDAENPNGGTEPMWKHTITHTISKSNPVLTFLNNIRFLSNTNINAGYFGMLPSLQSSMDKLLLSNGVEYNPIPQDGSEETFKEDVNSAMYVGQNTPGRFHATAMDVASIRDATNLGTSLQANNIGLLTFRSDDVTKVYFTFTGSNVFNAGSVYNVKHRIACIAGERYPTTL